MINPQEWQLLDSDESQSFDTREMQWSSRKIEITWPKTLENWKLVVAKYFEFTVGKSEIESFLRFFKLQNQLLS